MVLAMNSTGRMGIGIISAGKVGAALGSALRAQGHTIVGAYATSPEACERLETMLPRVPALDVQTIVERSELVILAVPDSELAPLVSGLAKQNAWQAGQIVVHTAGRFGVGILSPAQQAGALCLALHPAMVFTGTSLDISRLQGCPFAVTAPAPLLPIGQALVTEMGGMPVIIAEADRGTYHAALLHGSVNIVTLIEQSITLLKEIGVADPGNFLRALTPATLEETLSAGKALPASSIAGISLDTLQQHLLALAELASADDRMQEISKSYLALVEAGITNAVERNLITAQTATQMREILS